MKQIYINNHMGNFYLFFVMISFVVIPFLLLLMISGTTEGMVLSFVGVILLITWGAVVECSKTKVEYDEKNIVYKHFGIEKKIEIEKVKKVSWSVYGENYGRGGTHHRIEIVFGFGDDDFDEVVLNDCLTSEQISDIIDGRSADTPIMGLYRFIEANYPEKTVGKVEREYV